MTHLEFQNMLGRINVVQLMDIPKFIQDVIRKTADGVDPALPGNTVADIGKPINQDSDSTRHAIPVKSGFKFGAASKKELEGVKPELVQMCYLALDYSSVDFAVHDGIRTVKEQQQHVANGTSTTMQSKHLKGLAVDLVPYVNGQMIWEWEPLYKLAFAVDIAATELGIAHKIRWGCAWDRVLSDFGGDASDYKATAMAYADRQKAKGRRVFLDGPHFEWVD